MITQPAQTDLARDEGRLPPEFWRSKRLFASPEVIESNPRRQGVAGWHSLELIRQAGPTGLSYVDWQTGLRTDIRNTSGTQHYHLRWDHDRGHIRVVKDHGQDTPSPFGDIEVDIRDVRQDGTLQETTKKALIDARRGQGQFRQGLEKRWNDACAVTGCKQREILRASHIRSWSVSSNEDRLNSCNGLLLSANLDALFDSGLVSFDSDGTMLVSDLLHNETLQLLGLPMSLRCPLTPPELRFLAYHRWKFFGD